MLVVGGNSDTTQGVTSTRMQCILSCFKSKSSGAPSSKRPLSDAAGPHFQTASLFVDASANYYGGGALQGAEVEWRVQGAPTHYRPPGWNGYIFGSRSRSGASPLDEIELRDELNLQGRSRLELKFTDELAPVPYLLRFEATVSDLSQQSRTVTGCCAGPSGRPLCWGQASCFSGNRPRPHCLEFDRNRC